MKLLATISLALGLMLAAACGEGGIRVGAKAFVEQEILARILEGVLENEGIATRPTYRCQDTFDCQHALQRGEIDVMVEYTGTAFHLLGEEPPADDPVQRLDALYEPLGVRWLAPLGFDNGYVWLVAAHGATDPERTLSELAGRGTLTVAVPPEFAARPRDGLAATARRYGMTLAPEPIVAQDPRARLEALVTGRADAAVVYGTDPSSADLGLAPLTDDLGFAPRYDAVVVATADALRREPTLAGALARLEGTLDPARMRAMNHAVATDGQGATGVARDFLRSQGLLEAEPRANSGRTRVTIAIDDAQLRRAFGPRVLLAMQASFPDRTASLERVSGTAADAVGNGRARFAVLGVESFFSRKRGRELVRRDDLEAIATLGQRLVHVLVAAGGRAWSGAVGVVTTSRSPSMTESIATDRGVQPTRFASGAEAVAALGDSIQTLVLAAPLHDPEVRTAIEAGARLVSVVADGQSNPAQQRAQRPYLRPARIGPDSYPHQPEAIETFSAQVVLVGPSSATLPGHGAAGPAGAVPGGDAPTLEKVQALRAALDATEAPDPSVPSSFSLGQRQPERAGSPWLDTLLNLFVLGFCGWLVVVVIKPARKA